MQVVDREVAPDRVHLEEPRISGSTPLFLCHDSTPKPIPVVTTHLLYVVIHSPLDSITKRPNTDRVREKARG